MTDSQPARGCVDKWAKKHGVYFVCRSYGEQSTTPISRSALEELATRVEPVAGGGGEVTEEMVERAALAYFGGKMPGPSGFLEGFKISMKEALAAALQVKP